MHRVVEPAILYFGTPVAIISTLNEDGPANLSPMSSIWWLGWSCMLGFDATSKSVENLRRTGELVINLPSVDARDAVDRLAMSSGSDPLPLHKQLLGYKSSADKFGISGLTPVASEIVAPPRVLECPIQLEARVMNIRPFATNDARMAIPSCAVEILVERIHVDRGLLSETFENRIDPDRWKPLIMNFREFYGLSERIGASRLGEGPEEVYASWKASQ